jgi:hypothetical protein
MQEPIFAMYTDMSHSHMEVLTGCNKAETVVCHNDVTDGDDHGRAETMEPCIACFRYLFSDDLEIRCGLLRGKQMFDMKLSILKRFQQMLQLQLY